MKTFKCKYFIVYRCGSSYSKRHSLQMRIKTNEYICCKLTFLKIDEIIRYILAIDDVIIITTKENHVHYILL